jgi:hypothetical protein
MADTGGAGGLVLPPLPPVFFRQAVTKIGINKKKNMLFLKLCCMAGF